MTKSVLDKTVLEYLAEAHLSNIAAVEHRKLAVEQLSIAKEMILAGNRTGNPLRDYVIVATGEDSEELVSLLHDTEKLLAGKVGELILFINTWEEEKDFLRHVTSPVCNILGNDTTTMKKLYLGVISGNKFIVNPQKKYCDFPTECLAEGGDNKNYFESQKSPGQEVVKDILLKRSQNFLRMIQYTPSFESWEFKIGSTEITNWMNKNPVWAKHVVSMSAELGRSSELGVIL